MTEIQGETQEEVLEEQAVETAEPPDTSAPSYFFKAMALVATSLSLLLLVGAYFFWNELDKLKNRGAPAQLQEMSESLKNLNTSMGDAQNQLSNLKGGFAELRELTNTRIQAFNTTTDNKISHLESKQQEEVTELKEKLAEARGTLNELSQQLQTAMGNLQTEQSKFQSQIQASVNAMDQELRRTREQRILDEVDHYIVLAEQRIKIEKDAQAAAIALEAALARVKQLKRASWQALTQAMEKDIETLKSIESPNINGYAQTLLDLQSQLSAIPLKGTDRRFVMNGKLPEVNKEDQGYMDRMWESVKSGLKMTVRIQKQGEPVTPLLSPEEGFFLYQNLRLKLEAARFALMRREQKIFVDSLMAAQQWFEQYFTEQGEASQLLLDTLKRLTKVNIAPDIPDISHTRQLHRETQASSNPIPRFGQI